MQPNDGLKQKFLVIKADTGELVKNCFVLRPDRDPAAVTALRAYAEVTDNETLAGDIINWIGANKNCKERNLHWNDDGSCPVCGKYDNKDPFGSKVCPNCGAKMNQEEDHGN